MRSGFFYYLSMDSTPVDKVCCQKSFGGTQVLLLLAGINHAGFEPVKYPNISWLTDLITVDLVP